MDESIPLVIMTQAVLAVISLVVGAAIYSRKVLWPLTAFLIALSAHMFINVLNDGYEIWLPAITPIFSFLYGPLLFLFVENLIYIRKNFNKKTLWHFVPALFVLPISMLTDVLSSVLPLFAMLSICVYFTLSFRLIRRYHRVIKDTRSTDADNLLWLRNLLLLMCLVGCFELARLFLGLMSLQIPETISYLLVNLVLLFFVCAIAIKAIRHIEFFDGISDQDKALSEVIEQQSTSYTYTPDMDLTLAIADIKQAMEQDKLYLLADVTISQLAEKIGYTAREVSIAINSQMHCNFNEFINTYRIGYASTLLNKDKKHSILDIMHRSGFNSKAAFYAAFKKQTGRTPSQYRDTNKDVDTQINN